ncbi:MAG: DMT family transporter [Caldilineaceae bacterium]|nr:DMT family transporter [Caldilineaceae bacterium]
MPTFLYLFLVAVVGGIAVTLQSQFMGSMDQTMGTRESVFITYAGGGLLIALMMLLVWRGGNLAAWRAVPPYAFLAGILGLIIVGSIGFVVPRLGLVTAFSIMLASQFISSAVVDHFGLLGAVARPLDGTRLAGVLVLCVGIWLIIR